MTHAGVAKEQLTLNVGLRDETTRDNFLPLAGSAPALSAVSELISGLGDKYLYVYGPADSGKSHLLQSACHELTGEAVYLPLAELSGYPADELLSGMEGLQLICLDDVEAVVGDSQWEQALFHLFNRASAQGCRLLFAANAAPRHLSLQLEDLRSRLSWGLVYQLSRPTDTELADILVFRAERRGLNLAPETASYIVNRAPRALGELLSLLDSLDQASLREQRALSIPFVKSALGW